jgi:hypothetical protein
MARPDRDDAFFIGWAEAPHADRRFFLRLGLGLMAGTAGLGAGLASLQRAPGAGGWDPDKVREWRGTVGAAPYAMLRSRDLGGGVPRTALLSCLGKCGVAAQIGALAGLPVVVTGSLIQRGPHSMIAVDEQGPWLRRDEGAPTDVGSVLPEMEALGEISLSGEILDSKCWFGAMRPSDGKLHKACASLCIRGGIPPAFFARGPAGQTSLMIMTDAGRAHGQGLLALVADPVRLSGRLFRRGDLLMLDTPVSAIRRL